LEKDQFHVGISMIYTEGATIYRVLAEEIRWEAVFPDSESSIPTIRADFLCFTSKFVQISPNLPANQLTILFTSGGSKSSDPVTSLGALAEAKANDIQ